MLGGRKIKTHPRRESSGEQIPRAGSEHRGAGGDLTAWGCVRKGLAAALGAQMFSAPPSGCETLNQPLEGLGAVQGRCGDVSEGCGPAQGGDSPAGFGVLGEHSSGMLAAPTTGALAHGMSSQLSLNPSQNGA